MTENLKFDAVNYEAYKNAKSTRPAWANALILGAVLFIAGIAAAIMVSGTLAVVFMVGAGIAALIAGVLALMHVRRGA